MQTPDFRYIIPYFLFMWIGITTFLGVLSGWFFLMRRFPDKPEKPILTLRGQSGSMGLGVAISGMLKFSVCPSGLRVGMSRFFGPFCRDFFVPWEAVSVTRKTSLLRRVAVLNFGDSLTESLVIPEQVANLLGHAAGEFWPEPGPLPVETSKTTLQSVFKQWLLKTGMASAFFLVAPRIVAPGGPYLPYWMAILFPAVVFGAGAIFQYWSRSQGLK